jgi:hypothetical protein
VSGPRIIKGPEIPDLSSLVSFDGLIVFDNDDVIVPPSFTLVPLHALNWYIFSFFSHKVFDKLHDILCQKITVFKPISVADPVSFENNPCCVSLKIQQRASSKVSVFQMPFATCLHLRGLLPLLQSIDVLNVDVLFNLVPIICTLILTK